VHNIVANCYSDVAYYSVVIRVTFVLYAVFYYSLDVNEDQWELISDTVCNLSMSRRLQHRRMIGSYSINEVKVLCQYCPLYY